MAQYRCTCGHQWSDITGEHEGYIFWLSGGQADSAVVKDMWAFAQACAAGKRSEWIMSYFDKDISSLSDADIADTIFLKVGQRFSSDVFRCPVCSRLMLNDPSNPKNWLSYAPDPTTTVA
jgi:hypothetical protein